MSYQQTVNWRKTHRRGTNQPLVMSTHSGFWPSQCFLTDYYWPYVEQCRADGIEPVSSETHYRMMVKE